MKTRVRVFLQAEAEVEIEVEHDEGSDPTDLTQEERRQVLRDFAPSDADWEVTHAIEVKP